jgi:uncharacterized metal-binding protein
LDDFLEDGAVVVAAGGPSADQTRPIHHSAQLAVAAEVAALVDAGETVFRVVAADGSNSRTESSSPTMFVPSH